MDTVPSLRKAIADLQKRREQIAAEIERQQAVLEQIDESISSMEQAARVVSGSETNRRPKSNAPQGGRMRPTEAVYQYVKGHPGSRSGQVVEALADKIDSVSSAPKKLLHSIIAQMVRTGRLVRGTEGGLRAKT